MPYTVYKVINQITQDFYIGVHKTDNPHDGYLGSGKAIRQQVALHGPENFTKEILYSFEAKHEAYKREEELVRPLLGTPGCLNIHPGGKGGFSYLGPRRLQAASAAGCARIRELRESDPDFDRRCREQRIGNVDRARANGTLARTAAAGTASWTGQKHTQAARNTMSHKKRNEQNPCYGTCWVTNPVTEASQRIQREELVTWVAAGWVPGRRCSISEEGRAAINAGKRAVAQRRKL